MTALKKKEKDDLLEENRAIKEQERRAREVYGIINYACMKLDSKPEKKSSNNFDFLEKAFGTALLAGVTCYGGIKLSEAQANMKADVRRRNEGYHHPDDFDIVKGSENTGKAISNIIKGLFRNKK